MSDHIDEQEPAAAEMNPPEPTQEEIDAQAAADRLARFQAHPHTQLRKIQADLRAPATQTGDVTTRMAHLHSAMQRLIQVVLSHTPPPEEDHGEG
jgi:hypothetical protein